MSAPLATAIRLLSRREHSAQELRNKLNSRDWPDDIGAKEIDELIIKLQEKDIQSDQRFAESYTHMRYNKGYGPVRIDNELRERGVSEIIRHDCLHAPRDGNRYDWWALMQQVRVKKFGEDIPQEYKERARQMRFLQYRGFTSENIRELLC